MTRSLIHLADYDRDELGIGRRIERDFERETGARRRGGYPGRTRRRFARIQLTTEPTQLACPACQGPAFVPADSDHERIDCITCDARLVSRRALDGTISIHIDSEDER